jgi:hypothetical protein
MEALRAAYAELQATFVMVTTVLDWKGFFGYGTKDAWYNTTIKKITTARVPFADGDPRASASTSAKAGEKRSPKAFWIHRVGGRTVFHYKEFGTDPHWMPFKRDTHGAVMIPHETDPDGIPLFGVGGCRDPAGIKEAELRIASLSVPTKEELSSSDEDEPQPEAQPAEFADGRQRKRPPFDAPQIAAKVKALDEEIFQETGSRLFSASDMKEWEDFGNTAPSSLAHVPQDQRTTFEDFCACATTEPTPSAKEVEQQELVEWKDPEKQGRGSSKGKLGKERIERKQLKLGDVEIGSFILTIPDDEDDYGSPRQKTMFNLAKVTSHIDDNSIEIWWLGCFFKSIFTADVNGEWALLCKSGHQFTGQCGTGKCGAGVGNAGKWLDTISLKEIVLADVRLKKGDGRLFVSSMRAIARCRATAHTQPCLQIDPRL